MTYDHNQTVVPDAFMALYVRRGRPTAPRHEVEQRHELAEDLALHLAAIPAVAAVDVAADQRAVLARCRDSLLAEPAQVDAAEAGWVVRRVAELLEWDLVFDPDADIAETD